jgi:hypothetical protein
MLLFSSGHPAVATHLIPVDPHPHPPESAPKMVLSPDSCFFLLPFLSVFPTLSTLGQWQKRVSAVSFPVAGIDCSVLLRGVPILIFWSEKVLPYRLGRDVNAGGA